VRCGYHGWHDWCLPLEDFVPAGLDAQVLEFSASEPATLARRFDEHPGQIAAVILAPEMIPDADAATLGTLMEITRRHGAVFVLDEVKTAFRTAPGSVQQRAGLVPDVTTLSKALGNGWPVAAVIGSRAVMRAGAGMHYSGTLHGDTAAIAAALATLDVLDREPVAAKVWGLGERLIDGLNAIAREFGVAAIAYGEPLPPMPFLKFQSGDVTADALASQRFYEEVLARGVLLHPRHMWFVSDAHSGRDVDRALEVARDAMKVVADARG
jgi:glutamate-1-semialdehyde 2,1-aminomutase